MKLFIVIGMYKFSTPSGSIQTGVIASPTK